MKTRGLMPMAARLLAMVVGVLTLSQAALGAEIALRWLDRDEKAIASMSLGLEDLDALSQSEISTSTPWTEGVDVFSGPKLSDLSRLAGFEVVSAEIRAMNEYSVEVPREDWVSYEVIIASRINGAVPRVYEKGPFWLMYPVDDMDKPIPKKYVSRMIWQIETIDFHVK